MIAILNFFLCFLYQFHIIGIAGMNKRMIWEKLLLFQLMRTIIKITKC